MKVNFERIDLVRQIGKSIEEILIICFAFFFFAFGKSSMGTNFICNCKVFIIRPQAHINIGTEV